MATSTLITDYLGRGLASARPSSPPIGSGAMASYFSTDTGDISFWNGTAWVSAAKPRNAATLLAQFVLGTVATNGTFHFAFKAPYAGTINSLDAVSATGSFTLAVRINAVAVTGLSAVSVTSTSSNTPATGANTFPAGADITGVISAASGGPTNAVLNLNVTWTG